jgi:hypothetical protein
MGIKRKSHGFALIIALVMCITFTIVYLLR